MRIAICEDKQEDIEKIETMVCRVCDNIEEIVYCTDGNSLLAELEKNRADLVFLDIDLKERAEGIMIKNKICKEMLEVYIIFVTSHNEYMPDAFGDRVLGFIIKDWINSQR